MPRIPALPSGTTVATTALIPYEDVAASTTKKATKADFLKDAPASFSAGAIPTAAYADASITTVKLSTSSGEIGGAWATWTPTYANLTVGNGTVVAKYMKVGKTVHFRYKLIWGSTTTFTAGSNISVSPPVPIATDYAQFDSIGSSTYFDTSSGTIYTSFISFESTNSMRPFVSSAGGTYVSAGQVNNSNPMTWATGDTFSLDGWYEAA